MKYDFFIYEKSNVMDWLFHTFLKVMLKIFCKVEYK